MLKHVVNNFVAYLINWKCIIPIDLYLYKFKNLLYSNIYMDNLQKYSILQTISTTTVQAT